MDDLLERSFHEDAENEIHYYSCHVNSQNSLFTLTFSVLCGTLTHKMQIKVTRGHKVLMTLTAIALVLKVAALVSPGWMRIAWYVKTPMMIDNGGIGPRPMEVQDDEPIAMAKRSAEHPDNNQVISLK